jgi:hypothetical protein
MQLRHCPRCEARVPRFLGECRDDSSAWHYNCSRCDHHWTASKDNGSTLAHLTPLIMQRSA